VGPDSDPAQAAAWDVAYELEMSDGQGGTGDGYEIRQPPDIAAVCWKMLDTA
jgi:hypothetical protein